MRKGLSTVFPPKEVPRFSKNIIIKNPGPGDYEPY